MNNIVFILGAGASKPFKFPLGGELIKNIIKGINEVDYEDIEDSFRGNARRAGAKHYDFLVNPYHALYSELLYPGNDELIKNCQSEQLRKPEYHMKFADLLNRCSRFSIDYVLAENPSYSFIGRLYITLEILSAYFHSKQTLKNALKDSSIKCDYDRYVKISKQYSDKEINNWYVYLAEFIKKLGKDTKELKELYKTNAIKFVTFNYDMSLEYYFKEFFLGEVYSGFDIGLITSNIFHVYGGIDVHEYKRDYDRIEANYLKLLFKQAGNISLIREGFKRDNNIVQHIINADVICVCGFAFDEINREIIGLDSCMRNPDKKVYVHNYKYNQYIINVIEVLKQHGNIESKEGEIKELFESGFISERIVA